jgi:nicotinamide phosphoribosyltransferase
MLVRAWYPTTVCTISYQIKKLIDKYAKITGCEVTPFHLHDFGYRGVSSEESAGIGGCAHLVNFYGTDTLAGIANAMEYYNSNVCGYSVCAAEHSTITSWGKSREIDAYDNMLKVAPNDFIVAVVSDSYDIYNAVENIWCGELKDKIIARKGRLVIRPDSGYPPEVSLKLLQILDKKLGSTVNKKGYKTINHNVGIIYGDGINYDMIENILKTVTDDGFSTDNIIFGMGGALLQQLDRDTQKFAFKASNVTINNEEFPVFKNPITDSNKVSKSGRLKLKFHLGDDGYIFETVKAEKYLGPNLLRKVYYLENNTLRPIIINENFDVVRNRANSYFIKNYSLN